MPQGIGYGVRQARGRLQDARRTVRSTALPRRGASSAQRLSNQVARGARRTARTDLRSARQNRAVARRSTPVLESPGYRPAVPQVLPVLRRLGGGGVPTPPPLTLQSFSGLPFGAGGFPTPRPLAPIRLGGGLPFQPIQPIRFGNGQPFTPGTIVGREAPYVPEPQYGPGSGVTEPVPGEFYY
jgi:hypothetical protein